MKYFLQKFGSSFGEFEFSRTHNSLIIIKSIITIINFVLFLFFFSY
jgi:hypothetical protein